MKAKVIFLLIGIFIGWLSVPIVRASTSNEITRYIDALRRIITIMEQIQITSAQTAENTKAIKEKLGAK